MYTVGKTYMINLFPFTGEGSTVLATEVKLKLNKFKLQLYVVEDRGKTKHFICDAEPVEGVHRTQPTVPLWQDLYPVGRGQLPCIPQGARL